MTDLHCHILPGIDDGAKTVEDSIEILKMELEQGVNSVVFTPHFDIRETNLKSFLEKRKISYESLVNHKEFADLNISTKLGAEVYFSSDLLDIDLTELCIENTDYLLIELPVSTVPVGLNSALSMLVNNGFTPILAHIERYPYISENPEILYDLVSNGCFAQANAYTINRNDKFTKMIYRYIKWGLVHFISSDCHSTVRRPPNTLEAFSTLDKNLSEEYVSWLRNNSNKVFNGKYVDLPVLTKPKKILGLWI